MKSPIDSDAFTVSAALLAAAMAIGTMAWVSPAIAPVGLVMAAFFRGTPPIRRWGGRLWAALVAMAWWLPGNLLLMPAILDYFGPQPWWAQALLLGLPLLLTVIQGLPFLLVPAGGRPLARATGVLAALAVSTLPPFGLLAWRNPLLAAGALVPGSGWLGVALCALLMAGIAAWPRRSGEVGSARRWPFMLPLIVAGAGAIAWDVHAFTQRDSRSAAAMRAALGWYPISTQAEDWNRRAAQDGAANVIAERSALYLAPGSGIRGLVFPEAILSPFTDADLLMLLPLRDAARAAGMVILVGVSSPMDAAGRWRNGVYALGTVNGWVDEVRVPMPAGHWRPVGGVRLRALAPDVRSVLGQRIAFSICYEDTILWPHGGLLAGKADMLVSMGNTWAIRSSYVRAVQAGSATLLARLAGVPLIRAENRPGDSA